jgi:EmrB/QacA subfamily drug resistance transporter
MGVPYEVPTNDLSRRQVYMIIAGLILGVLLAAMDQTIMATALPTVVGDLGGLSHLAWVVTTYIVASTATTPLWGKFGDLYGRKGFLQTSIAIFVVGSALCGLAQNMASLITFRAIQGIGAGGVISLAMAVLGDVVPPRERGRYQGYMQAFMSAASVVAPLLGGFFVDHTSWRWVFYINLPIGVVALLVIGVVLRVPTQRMRHEIDYLGSALLIGAVSCLLLVAAWTGDRYSWNSPQIIGLTVTGVVLIAGLLVQERRAAEPVIPLSMFRNPVFTVATVATFFTAWVLIVMVTYLPMFLQIVTGETATNSGLLLIPLVAGLAAAAVVAGQLISRTGRYKIFPILGMAITTVAIVLLSRVGPGTTAAAMTLYMILLGVGLGFVSQVLIVAIQNAVERRQLGTATAGANFFRSLGGSIGIPVYGAIMTAQLNHWLPRRVPQSASQRLNSDTLLSSPAAIRALPHAARVGVADAVSHSVTTVFTALIPVSAISLLIVLFLKEKPMGDRAPAAQAVPAGGTGSRGHAGQADGDG